MRKNKPSWIQIASINLFLTVSFTFGIKCEQSENNSRKCNQANTIDFIYKVSELLGEEMKVYDVLKVYRSALATRWDLINNFIEDYEETEAEIPMLIQSLNPIAGTESLMRAFEISKHPFMAYRLIRRFTFHLSELASNIEIDADKKLLEKLNHLKWNNFDEDL